MNAETKAKHKNNITQTQMRDVQQKYTRQNVKEKQKREGGEGNDWGKSERKQARVGGRGEVTFSQPHPNVNKQAQKTDPKEAPEKTAVEERFKWQTYELLKPPGEPLRPIFPYNLTE